MSLLLLALLSVAAAMPQISITATVHDNLQTISGTLTVHGDEDIRLTDILSLLPEPPDDLTAHRTFPAGPEQGWLHRTPSADGVSEDFYAVLPRRYGASGLVPGRGLFLNGLWHPQPMRGPVPAVVSWDVTLQLPDDAVGALNDSTGSGTLQWSGESERLSLAVIPGGQIRDIPLPRGRLRVVDSRARPRLDERLAAVLTESWPAPLVPDEVVVITPSRRRLVRPGAGLLFLSDRAFRLSGRLWRYHIPAVRQGLLAAGLPISDPWLRDLSAGALVHGEPAPDVLDSLGWVSWIPQIDALIYSGQMPFFSDVFDEMWPGDPLADDLQEVASRRIPGRALAARIDAVYGEGSALRIAQALLAGSSLSSATQSAGVPPAVLEGWSLWPPDQDLSVTVAEQDSGRWQISVHRETTPDAPVEPVDVVIDGIQRELVLGPGSDVAVIEQPQRPRQVQLDPDATLRQTARANDRWPSRWTTIAYLSPAFVQDRIVGSANLGFRKQYNTRWRYNISAYRGTRTLAGADVSATRSMGPLLDRRYRPLRLWMGVGSALLDPAFRPTRDGELALEAYTGIAHDTRFSGNQARSGHRLSLSGGVGTVPASSEQWLTSQATALGLLPVTGRVTLAGRVKAGVASGAVEHRLLNLGGDGAVQGLPYDAAVGNQRVVLSPELRWTAIKHASVPLPLMWASDLQLVAGVDAGGIWRAGTPSAAVGWSVGGGCTADILGADPSFGSIGLAGPLYTSERGITPLRADELQLYVRISQTF